MSDGIVIVTYKSPVEVTSANTIPAEDSATLAASRPVAMNTTVMPSADCKPLLLAPDINAPTFATA